MRRTANDFIREDVGASTVVFSLGIAGILLSAGVAIDYGRWQMDQTQLQAVADAASLAAAHRLKSADWSNASIGELVAKYVTPNGVGLENIQVDSVAVDDGVK
ncbi:MAG: hypothetical protein KDK89_17500 [Alphaproteobacteria bacterium]|nr:hypothetical protein [Alphaproteobacteria bacterium]